ncbi:MAG: hypothetical protein IJ424_06985 [Oscillospiraceae bacterium]|nr:hypothetical protein [Oscillospiraceae bacterium]
MSKTKKALINTASVAMIMIVYHLLPNSFDFGFLPIEIASDVIRLINILQYILVFVHNLILFSVLILIWNKNKCLLEKPLFDKSLPFAKRFNLDKLVVAFAVSALSYLVNYVTAMLSYIVCPDFNLRLALSAVYMSLFWIVFYFAIAGKGHNIFKKSKYVILSSVIILLLTVISIIVNIGYIVMMNSSFAQNGNINSYLSMTDYSTYMVYFNVFSKVIVVSVIVFFHTLSAPEEVPLEPTSESAEVTE